MTSNQIAAEGNRIQRDVSMAQLRETERHNKEQEATNSIIAQAQQEANQIAKDYNNAQIAWQREYQAKWREYELAQEDRKLDLQEELRKLEQRKVDTDAEYKRQMASNAEFLAGLENKRTDADIQFKEFQKSAKWEELGLSAKDVETRRKAMEYDKALKHEQIMNDYAIQKEKNKIAYDFNVASMDYKWAEMNYNREVYQSQLSKDYYIAEYQLANKQRELDIAERNLTAYEKLSNSQRFQNISSGLYGRSGIIPGTISAVKDVSTIVGGLYGTKSAKQIAASLFKY